MRDNFLGFFEQKYMALRVQISTNAKLKTF